MEALFLKLFNMSITASWLVLAVIVLRLLLKKAPKAFVCFLWLLVAIRLIFPISIESVVSLIPSTETITEESLYSATPVIDSGIGVVNDRINPVISESLAPEIGASVNPLQVIVYAASYIWVIGMLGMLVYAVVSYLRLWFKVREAVVDGDRIWLCDRISTPFILGIIRPRIYIPSWVEKDDMEYVIAHERAHLKRKDHWWKPLGFILLTVYWFNPVMWVAYILLCKDIECACDEKVLNELGVDCRKEYSNALVNCSVSRRSVAVCPLAFGEVGVKDRIKSVLSYKKPAFWVIMIALILCAVFVIVFMTNPSSNIRDMNYGKYITMDELYENFEICLNKYSIEQTPRFDVPEIIDGQILSLNLYKNEEKTVDSGYFYDMNDLMAAAVTAYTATQYQEYTEDMPDEDFLEEMLYELMDEAFYTGKAETYLDRIYLELTITCDGYRKNVAGQLKAEKEKPYLWWNLYMERVEPFEGIYYLWEIYNDKTYDSITPTPAIELKKDYSFILSRGTGESGVISGHYELDEDKVILVNEKNQERYVFEFFDTYFLKYLQEESDSIRLYNGSGITFLKESVFQYEAQHEDSKTEMNEPVLYYGQDVNGYTPSSIIIDYYENLDEEDDKTKEQWFTDEYLDRYKNVEYQAMELLTFKQTGIAGSDIRESDRVWIDEIKGKYSCYCFIQTKTELICKEDGPSGKKGEIIEQQYYFALVLDPADGCWKIDDFGYPGFDIPIEKIPKATGYKVTKEGYELAYITSIDEGEKIKISVDYVDWISDNTQPNGFQIINTVEDNTL